MDVNLNELKQEDECLPELRKKWIEASANILMGAPLHLPPLREVMLKVILHIYVHSILTCALLCYAVYGYT
jgi:hypothetical protein